ncbi:hypothetical protein VXS72_05675 [Acinetobacter pittii]|uniref:hypothetical protein n=1 Tax=Acinetobacter pittii TaxID=48296 RepID=UPI002E187A49|nr:hypothetical protein [Acinetobacter pittii]
MPLMHSLEYFPPLPFKSLFEKYNQDIGCKIIDTAYISQKLTAFDSYFSDMANLGFFRGIYLQA